MANHKSAVKRARQNDKRRIRNKAVRTRVKSVTKDLRLSAEGESKDVVLQKLNTTQSAIDIAAKKGVIHKNTAARKISRLTKLVNKISA